MDRKCIYAAVVTLSLVAVLRVCVPVITSGIEFSNSSDPDEFVSSALSAIFRPGKTVNMIKPLVSSLESVNYFYTFTTVVEGLGELNENK